MVHSRIAKICLLTTSFCFLESKFVYHVLRRYGSRRIIYVFCSGVCGKVSESAWRPVIGDNRVEFQVVVCIATVDALPV